MIDDFDKYKDSLEQAKDDLETAWGIIANASGGDWKKESKDWQEAAARWRDNWIKNYATKKDKTMISVKETLEDMKKDNRGCYSAPSMPMQNAPRDKSKVEMLISELSEVVKSLEVSQLTLEERLNPVIRPEPQCESNCKGETKVDCVKSPICYDIQNILNRLYIIVERNRSLTSRVEV